MNGREEVFLSLIAFSPSVMLTIIKQGFLGVFQLLFPVTVVAISFSVLYFVCMYVCVPGECVLEGVGSPATGVTDGHELPCGCWEPNPSPLAEQQCSYPLSRLSSPYGICFY